MRIYVAGPYSADSEVGCLVNTYCAIDAGIEVARRGHTPFIPHLNHIWDLRAKQLGVEYSHAFWLEWCLQWLPCCDALLFLGHSKGADMELNFAKKAGMQIFYSVDEIE